MSQRSRKLLLEARRHCDNLTEEGLDLLLDSINQGFGVRLTGPSLHFSHTSLYKTCRWNVLIPGGNGRAEGVIGKVLKRS